MADPKQPQGMRARQAGDYRPPILVEPAGGPVPVWQPLEDLPGAQSAGTDPATES